ncbi:MAG: phosphate/phosphite/phosphonate ABC transporter substrate-binding protein [Candidatus Cloacimonetes bacterium]|nr:phosphate/phosphite/phosphonate ABC transporter substrate-binding protein [Candidatus Cloacimonadota bacterium]
MRKITIFFILIIAVTFSGCGKKGELGSQDNPIKMYFVPSMEAGKVVSSGEAIASQLELLTGYKFKVAVPTSYAAVIEAMGVSQADIGWLPTFAYILAKQRFNAQIGLTTIRNGLESYRGQFVVRADSDIKSLADIEGKTIAFTDASSTSGYIYPSALLKKNGITPGKYYFAGGHPQAILSVYQGRADVGCSYWSPAADSIPQDARKAVMDTYPDIMEQVVPIAFTDWIPNDTVTFRQGISEEIRTKVINALMAYAQTAEGKRTLQELYSVDGFVLAVDADYDVVREALDALDKNAEEFLK